MHQEKKITHQADSGPLSSLVHISPGCVISLSGSDTPGACSVIVNYSTCYCLERASKELPDLIHIITLLKFSMNGGDWLLFPKCYRKRREACSFTHLSSPSS